MITKPRYNTNKYVNKIYDVFKLTKFISKSLFISELSYFTNMPVVYKTRGTFYKNKNKRTRDYKCYFGATGRFQTTEN